MTRKCVLGVYELFVRGKVPRTAKVIKNRNAPAAAAYRNWKAFPF